MVPQGVWALEPDALTIGANGATGTVRARRNRDEITLEFTGLAAQDFPLSVEVHDADEPWGDRDHLRFFGPRLWHREAARVPRLQNPAVLVVRAAGCAHLGRYEPSGAGELRVQLEPAATLRVRLREAPQSAPVVTATGEHGDALLLLGRTFVQAGGELEQALVGAAVVEPGRWRVSYGTRDRGVVTRSVVLAARASVEID